MAPSLQPLAFMMKPTLLALCLVLTVACDGERPRAQAQPPQPSQPSKESSMQLRSSAFADRAEIPARYTCEGENVSPPLQWSGLPDRTASLVLIMDDPDAPDPAAPQRTFVHWVLFDLPPSAAMLAEDLRTLPLGAGAGLNDWQRPGYGGPCPPIGRHRYFHKLYALDTRLELIRPTKAEVEAAMEGHVLAQATLLGTYQKARAAR